MDKDTARQAVRSNWRRIITRITSPAKERVNGETSWICPICGHGTHGDGLTFDPRSKDGNGLKCFGCGWSGDIIDLYMKQTGQDYGTALSLLAQEIGVQIDGSAPAGRGYYPPTAAPAAPKSVVTSGGTGEDEKEPDYTAFFEKANKHLNETDYHRGISAETLDRFKVGYIADWRNPKAPAAVPGSPRLIIPTSAHSYLARDTRRPLPAGAERYAKSKVGKVHIFNAAALATDQPVFVVEGEIDALSIIDVGGQALALGSASNWKRLVSLLNEKAPSEPLILALDNDGPGQKEENKLAAALEQAGIFFYRCQIAAPHKDANEALNVNRAAFAAAVEAAQDNAREAAEAEKAARREELEKEAAAYSLQNFIDQIVASASASYIPTGFEKLDELLDGGLFPGLYIVGAISSLGKTTFCLQMADQIAAAGHDVLIFSLEMDRNELIAKSVSRLTVLQDIKQNGTTANAKTTRGILTGSRYAGYSRKEKDLIQSAVSLYGEFAKRIYITEGVGDVGVKEIQEKTRRHFNVTGRRPVVLVDYLQIIAPADIRATDKQNTDKAVLELKRLSRDLKTPVIAISAFNRANYKQGVNLSSFRESSSIEYSADVLLGLQHDGMDSANDDTAAAQAIADRAAEVAAAGQAQKIQAKVLKNRNGRKGVVTLEYYPMFNYFKDAEERPQPTKKARY